MRDIKFRAKRLDNGKWMYGDLHIRTPHAHIHSEKGYQGFIDTDTIWQYTGLHDRDDNEIYEGDIIDFYSPFWRDIEYPTKIDPKHYYRLVVVWNPRDCGFGLVSLKEAVLSPQEQSPCGITQISDSYLIGNIHDNPELLKSL